MYLQSTSAQCRCARIRHALAAGLSADIAGVIAAVVAVSYLYG